MRFYFVSVLLQLIFFSSSLCELNVEKRDSFLNDFIDYLNSRPDQPYVYDDGLFLKSSQLNPNTYKIDIRVKVFKSEYPSSYHFEQCTATILDLGENGITIPNNEYQCIEWMGDEATLVPDGAITDAVQVTEEHLVKEPIRLDNEVQPNNVPISGEQFIAIPRDRSGPCIGCSSHVDPSAAGVDELAALGARHLDKHEPNVKHTVTAVHDVERQVQVTNGIRYILTLSVNCNNCTELSADNCISDKICKISILSKPWVKFPDGSKYKAVLANNCTEQWLFGDDGEPVPEVLDENKPTSDNDKVANSELTEDTIKFIHTVDVQAQQQTQALLSNEQIKNIQEQIIPYSEFAESRNSRRERVSPIDSILNKKNIKNNESAKNPDEDIIQVRKHDKLENTKYITYDKKKAIDDMLNLFNFAEFQPLHEDTEDLSRGKRSYTSDLQVMSVLEKFQKIKRKLKNAKHIYKLGNLLVDYLNEMDMEVKTRLLKDVIFAEEEIEKDQHFFYIRVRVIIPCDKVECDNKDTQVKICNGVIDSTDSKSSEVVDTFCYDEEKKSTFGKVKNVPDDDPILLKLTNETIKKIEDNMHDRNALRLIKIINANTQKVSGTLTKISMVLEFTACNKTVPFFRRRNCSTVQNLGTKICEAEIHERHWLKEKKITYTCTDRPMDETIEDNVFSIKNKETQDSQIMEIVNEALQLLEVQSDRKNKQKIVEIKSVSTQIIVGQLTNIDFVVGYTKCFINDLDIDLNNCELIENERLRKCQAQVWERPWLQEGRQIKVVCDDTNKTEINEIGNRRRKREIPGGANEADVNDPKYLQLAQKSLSKYLQDSGETRPHTVVKVNKVTVQVVSGTLISIDFEVQGIGEVFSCKSKVWEQVWLNKTEVTNVTCLQNNLSNKWKRQAPGAPVEVNPKDETYFKLAQESLSKYLQDSGNTEPHTVVKVNKVTVQVVAGFLTKIDFDVYGSGELFPCTSEVLDPAWPPSREITVTCRKDQNSRQKRQMPGAPQDDDPNDPKFMMFAQESLAHYSQVSGSNLLSSKIKVDRVTESLVAGTLYRMYFTVFPHDTTDVYNCYSEVWERLWLNKREVTNVTCSQNNLSKRFKRENRLGEPTVKDPNDETYLKLAQESLSKYLQDSGNTEPHTVVKVNKVTVQVVAGTLTKIDFDVHGSGEVFSCKSEVWERPWIKSKEITVTCGKDQNSRQKRQMPGAPQDDDPNDPKFMVFAQESLENYSQVSGSNLLSSKIKVDRVTESLVAGTLYRMYFTVFPHDTTDVYNCYSEVWERLWLSKREVTNVTCWQNKFYNLSKRIKREHLVGGPIEKDPRGQTYLKLAQESLSKYLQDSGNTEPHTVVKVNKVTVQVVAGTLTKLDFDVQGPGEVYSCKSKVWERPWLKSKEITVTCGKDQNSRQKRHDIIVGGTVEEDPKDEKFIRLAEESLNKYVDTIGTTRVHKLIELNHVTTQLVSGLITRLDFVISPTNCDIHDKSHKVCSVIENTNVRCHADIWERPWLNSDYKIIDVTCDDLNKNNTNADNLQDEYLLNTGIKSRSKPRHRSQHVSESDGIPGGPIEQDPSKPLYRVLADEALRKYQLVKKISDHHEITHVNRVFTQHVAGMKYVIEFEVLRIRCALSKINKTECDQQNNTTLTCRADIWSRPWLKSKKIKVDCSSDDEDNEDIEEDSVEIKRKKRDIGFGSTGNKDPNDKIYVNLAKEAVKKYQRKVNADHIFKINKMLRVSEHVVSGFVTNIDFSISPTTCLQSDPPADVDDCQLQQPQVVLYCSAEINEPAIPHTMKIKIGCKKREYPSTGIKSHTKHRHRSQHVRKSGLSSGGPVEQDPSKPLYRVLADEALRKYQLLKKISDHHEITHVNRVFTQIVAGMKYVIEFEVLRISCALSEIKKTVCDQTINTTLTCRADIWDRPWLKSKKINVDCSSDDEDNEDIEEDSEEIKRKKRDIGFGSTGNKDPNDKIYVNLAKEAVKKYQKKVNADHIFKINKMLRVSEHVVSGFVTNIDFSISPTTCLQSDPPADVDNCQLQQPQVVLYCSAEINEPSIPHTMKIKIGCKKRKNASTGNKSHTKASNRRQHVRKSGRNPGGLVEQDPTKPLYMALADEALRKYQLRKKISDHHEITHVNKVATQTVSGIKYFIEFEVLRISCALNEINKTQCDQKNTTITCRADIWSRPWLKSKEINVDCSSDEASEDSEEESSSEEIKRRKRDIGFGRTDTKDPNDNTYVHLAKEAIKKYQKNVKADHKFKLNKMLRVTEHVASGFVTNIDFSISPTTCLLSDPPVDVDDCQLQQPQIVLYCSAEINEPSIPRTMRIKIGCKQRNKKKINTQKEVKLNREKRDSPYDDDYVEEDIKYYYADRAITDFNSRASTNNLYKVVSIHDVHRSVHMDTLMVRLYLEIAMTYCMRYGEEHDLQNCDEIDGMSHKLCLARVYPSPDDELVVQHATMTCDDDKNFETISGISIDEFIRVSIAEIEKSPDIHYRLVPLGEPNVIPSLNYKMPIRMNFVVHHTNCSKDIDLNKTPIKCVINLQRSGRNCHSLIYLMPNSRNIQNVVVKCAIGKLTRAKRSVSLDPNNSTADDLLIQKMVQESIEKLEMASEQKYKQRVLVINGYSSKIVSGRLTTIDFDVGYTTCLKYEWVENTTSCEFLEHLPRRHCISHVWERLWVENGRQIIVSCEDDETPLEAHIEFESAENAMQLANEALKHIEAKYPNPRRQKIVRIFSLEQQAIAGLHYRMKVEVGVTDCMALSINKDDCKLVNDMNSQNKFCRVNVWMRPWTDHPPSFRVTCDYQSGAMDEIYHHVQAERLFYDFLTTYKPDYLNDVTEMKKRFGIFKENVRKIHELNIYERGTARYAVTRFADLSYEEFSSKYLGLKPELRDHNQVPMRMADIPDVELPAKYDWRDYGAVTEVKDQGSCGSCWAFSVTGNIEGQWKLQSGKLVSLSEQELVDCDNLDNGCNGGLPDNAYRAIENLGGLETENDYPYEGTGDKCAFNKSLSRVHISGAVNITSNETDMAKWLTRNGPISIGINANAMQFYVGGISHPWKMLCSPKNLDHGVLIVGYGVKDYPLFHKHLPYWIVKNSWGERWGEQGYYRVYRGDGTCGVNQMASSAVI